MNSVLHTYVVFQLGRRHVSQAAIAARAGVSPAMVNYVLMGKRKSGRVQNEIASVLGFRSWEELNAEACRFQRVISSMTLKEA